MRRSKQMKREQVKTPLEMNNERSKPVVPVGPCFQAQIPDWTGPPHREYYKDFSSTKWLGIQEWPNKDINSKSKSEVIGRGRGRGRPNFCSCASPESVECVKRHINDKRLQLQFDLGPAFWGWKFDEIGEEVSKSWNLREQQEFGCIVKRSSPSQDKTFVELALERFPTRRIDSIARYYFNVYVPRRMEIQRRLGCEFVDTDDEDSGSPFLKGSRKRCRADGAAKRSGTRVKNTYLNGRR